MNSIHKNNPHTRRKLLCTESVLYADSTKNQHVLIPYVDSRYEFANTAAFSIACTISPKSIPFTLSSYVNIPTDTAASRSSIKGILIYAISGSVYYQIGGNLLSHNISTINRHIHVVATYNNKSMKLYINGILSTSMTATVSDSWGKQGIQLFREEQINTDDRYQANGGISHFSLYNKELSATEAYRLHNERGYIPKALHPFVVGYWSVQERSGLKLYDSVEQFNYAKKSLRQTSANENFDAGHTWTLANGFTIANGKLTISGAAALDNANLPIANLNVNPPLDIVRITIVVTSLTAGGFKCYAGGAASNEVLDITTAGTYTYTHVASGSANLRIRNSFANTVAEIDSVILENAVFNLTANHGDLIGYTTPEVAVNGSSKVDYYTKATGAFIDANGKEIKTGLPEIKSALKTGEGKYILAGLPTRAWPAKGFIHMDVVLDAWIPDVSVGEALFRAQENTYSGAKQVSIRKPSSNYTSLSFTHGAQFYSNDYARPDVNKLCSLTFTWDYAAQIYETYYNGHLVLSKNNSTNPAFNIEKLYIGSNGSQHMPGCIARTIFGDYVPDRKAILNICNNGHLANSKIRSLFYYIHSDIFNDNGTWKVRDQSGNNYHGTLNGYTANELNPASLEYAIKDLDITRYRTDNYLVDDYGNHLVDDNGDFINESKQY